MLLEMLEGRLALAIDGLAVAGDSWSDEYAAESYNYARNWAELLRSERGIDLGAPGDFADERGANGTEFNWAQVGATASNVVLDQFQDFNIIDQYEAGDVSHAVYLTSNADFAPGSVAFNNIADGTWTASSFEVDFFIIRFNELMIASLGSKGPKTLVTTIPDPTMTPLGRNLSDAAGRARVRSVVDVANARIKAKAAEYHLPVVDLAALQNQILGTPASPANSRTIGGTVFTPSGGIPSTNLFLEGEILPHTVYQAYIANAIIEGLNSAFGENIPRLTEQQILTAAGLPYGGTDTFPVNYSSLVIQPPVTVYLSYGTTSTPNDDFTARLSEWANARHIDPLTPDVGSTPGELSIMKANILSRLQTAFAGTAINFTGELPVDPRFEAIKLGVLSDDVTGTRTSRIGQGSFDWLNKNDQSTGYVFVDLVTRGDPGGKPDFDNIDLSTLSRADQLRYLENVLTFYIANEIGRGMGLQAADAFAYPSVTTATASDTGFVQFFDYMSGDPALGFNTASFNSNLTFNFSPLAKAKLQYGRWLTNPTLATIAETGSAHDTNATAQTLALVNSSTAQQRIAVVRNGSVAGLLNEADVYKITAAVGDKITVQIVSDNYGSVVDSIVNILTPDGSTSLAANDNTLLGNNRINQAGDLKVDDDSLILNYEVQTAGDVYIQVRNARASSGNYDMVVTNTVAAVPNPFPWHNASNPLNVTGNTTGTAVTAFDVVPVINILNLNPTGYVLPPPDGSNAPPPYYDVNPNGTVTAFDAIPIINYLNLNPLGGPGLEFVPFEEGSAGEATEPEPIVAPVAATNEEPGRNSRSASGSIAAVTALPYQPLSVASSLVASQVGGRVASNFAGNPLTWLLLAPVSSEGGEEAEENSSGSSEEHAQALESILGGEE